MPTPNIKSLLAALGVFATVALLVGGCADYRNHRDGITLAAGDAVHWNQAVHTIDPWPPGVFDTDIPGNGKRTEGVIQRYENPPPPATSTDVTVNVGDNSGPDQAKAAEQ